MNIYSIEKNYCSFIFLHLIFFEWSHLFWVDVYLCINNLCNEISYFCKTNSFIRYNYLGTCIIRISRIAISWQWICVSWSEDGSQDKSCFMTLTLLFCYISSRLHARNLIVNKMYVYYYNWLERSKTKQASRQLLYYTGLYYFASGRKKR
jgi:hypothetical protein